MTSEFPTAAEALSLAFDIVKTPCSAAEAERARVLLGIAVELRTDAQWRASRLHRTEIDQATAIRRLRDAGLVPPAGEPPADAKLRGYLDQWQQADAERYAGELAADRAQRLFKPETVANAGVAITETMAAVLRTDPSMTQRLPVIWQVGDKSQCRHCHTPIELHEVMNGDRVEGKAWWHRYTGVATCAVPATAGDLEGSEPTHTFAQPTER